MLQNNCSPLLTTIFFLQQSASNSYVKGTWYHVAGVFNSGGSMYIYVNGQKVGTQSLRGASVSESSSPVYIGGPNFEGYLDDVRIYNYSLSASQVYIYIPLALRLTL